MTQKELINQIKQLKDIKPRQEWVVLAKSEIFEGQAPVNRFVEAKKASVLGVIKLSILHRKLAYSFATLVLVIIGLVGFAQYTMPGDLLFPIKKIAERSEAALTGQTALRQNAVTLNNRINDLAKATKEGKKDNIPATISEIDAKALQLANDLKENEIADTETLKEIAVSLKVLADLPGADLSENENVKNLYQTVVENQIADLEESTLTDRQAEALSEAKDLYKNGNYVEALEKILLINVGEKEQISE